MAKLTYMPLPEDNDEAVVDGITFKAYEPQDVPDERGSLIARLSVNPWFSAGDPDPERLRAWKMVREAQAAASRHREFADQVEQDVRDRVAAAPPLPKPAPQPEPDPEPEPQPQPEAKSAEPEAPAPETPAPEAPEAPAPQAEAKPDTVH